MGMHCYLYFHIGFYFNSDGEILYPLRNLLSCYHVSLQIEFIMILDSKLPVSDRKTVFAYVILTFERVMLRS